MALQKKLQIVLFAVVFSLISFSFLPETVACSRLPKSKKTAFKNHKKKQKRSLAKHRQAKKSRASKMAMHKLPRKIVPPARVRIIDSGPKAETETFPMPITADVGREIANSPNSSYPEPVVDSSSTPVSAQEDEFAKFEVQ